MSITVFRVGRHEELERTSSDKTGRTESCAVEI